MSVRVGLVGLPNVGKSTLFSALTKKQVPASNYPFCTIEPHVGTVAVPDTRLDQLAQLFNSEKTIHATITFVDIAGLVKGASTGEGLGNKFLSNIRDVDAICHVIRLFDDPDIISVSGKVDPEYDMSVINLELILADLEMVNTRLEQTKTKTKSGMTKDLEKTLDVLTRCKEQLENEQTIADLGLTEEERGYIKDVQLLTIKPKVYVLNVQESQLSLPFEELPIPESLQDKKDQMMIICGKLEAELVELPENEVTEYLQAANITKTGLDQLIVKAYETLDLITYFTAGPKEAHAWTIKQGTLAPQAAGKIHTDFEKGFIKSETISWKDLLDSGGEVSAKEKGLMRMEGKDYLVQDGDVLHFHFSK